MLRKNTSHKYVRITSDDDAINGVTFSAYSTTSKRINELHFLDDLEKIIFRRVRAEVEWSAHSPTTKKRHTYTFSRFCAATVGKNCVRIFSTTPPRASQFVQSSPLIKKNHLLKLNEFGRIMFGRVRAKFSAYSTTSNQKESESPLDEFERTIFRWVRTEFFAYSTTSKRIGAWRSVEDLRILSFVSII